MCAQVVLTTREGAKMEGNVLPVSYTKLGAMVQKGDTIFLGRYLVTGSEESSCFLTVRASPCPPFTAHSDPHWGVRLQLNNSRRAGPTWHSMGPRKVMALSGSSADCCPGKATLISRCRTTWPLSRAACVPVVRCCPGRCRVPTLLS